MKESKALLAFGALSQASRLRVFRLLVRRGPEGMTAGAIAARLEVPPATLSFHLSHLSRAGLVVSRRQGREIIYALRVEGVRSLLGYLVSDCCHGRPELCSPAALRLPAGSVEGGCCP